MNQWLIDYWNYPDKQQAILLQYISSLDLKDRIQQIFHRFERTGKELSVSETRRAHEHLENMDFLEAKQLKRRKKIQKREAIICYIIAELLAIYELITFKAQIIFKNIANQKYTSITGETKDFDVNQIMQQPMASGKLLQDELLAQARYRSKQLADYFFMQTNYASYVSAYEPRASNIIQTTISDLLKATKNGYTGLYDELMTNVIGYTMIDAFRDKGVERVEFIAVMDARTTNRCQQLNGTRWNVDQLKLGYNVPPITVDSVPHPCRSALRAVQRATEKKGKKSTI